MPQLQKMVMMTTTRKRKMKGRLRYRGSRGRRQQIKVGRGRMVRKADVEVKEISRCEFFIMLGTCILYFRMVYSVLLLDKGG